MGLGARPRTVYLSSYPGPGSDRNGNTRLLGLGSGQPFRSPSGYLHLLLRAYRQPLPTTSTITCFNASHPVRLHLAANHRFPQVLCYRDTSFLALWPRPLQNCFPPFGLIVESSTTECYLVPAPYIPAFLKSFPLFLNLKESPDPEAPGLKEGKKGRVRGGEGY